MAIYTNLDEVNTNYHGMWESSLLVSTLAGHLWDGLAVEDLDAEEKTEIAIDNGVPVVVGAYTGNGLQERYIAIASKGDKIGVTGSPEVIKDAFTLGQSQPYNFYHKAGTLAKVYQVRGDEHDGDIFAVAQYQFVKTGDTDNVAVGNYVVVNEDGLWKAVTSKPSGDTYGFIGRIHSVTTSEFATFNMVRIEVLKNESVA